MYRVGEHILAGACLSKQNEGDIEFEQFFRPFDIVTHAIVAKLQPFQCRCFSNRFWYKGPRRAWRLTFSAYIRVRWLETRVEASTLVGIPQWQWHHGLVVRIAECIVGAQVKQFFKGAADNVFHVELEQGTAIGRLNATCFVEGNDSFTESADELRTAVETQDVVIAHLAEKYPVLDQLRGHVDQHHGVLLRLP